MTTQGALKVSAEGDYLRALTRCFGKPKLLLASSSEQEGNQIRNRAPSERDIKPNDLLFDPQGQLHLWHIDQIKDLLAQLPDGEKERSWTFMPQNIADILKKDERFFSSKPWPGPFARDFFKCRFNRFLVKRVPLPRHLLKKTPFDYLLGYSSDEISQFCSFMAIHTLSVPMKHMIEREKRGLLKKAMSCQSDKAIHLAYMRYLQSDINEQTAPISVIQFPLYKWDWKIENFYPLVNRFGLYCLAKLLNGWEKGFLDHIALKLEPKKAISFHSINRQGPTLGTNRPIVEQNLHRLAAKAGDFLLSTQNSQK